MATNNIKPFAIGNGANVTSQADYESLSALLTGFQSGKASSAQINKALRQSSFVASVLAQFISDKAAVDVLDNGNATTLMANLIAALKANGANDFLQKSSNLADLADKAAALSTLGGAPLSSPTFTGTPKGPTAAAGTNNTQIATTAFVQALIAGLLKTSNNLSEIAAAGPAAVASALTNLGLGEVATENIVPVNKGGTGASGRAGAVSGLGLLLQNRWISAAQTMTLGVPITLTHGLPITDPLTCYSDVMIVCSTANSGYSVGDVAIGPQMVDGASSSVNRTISCTPALSETTIQLNVGASGIYIVNKTNGTITPLTTLTGWRVYFRIFY